MKRLVLILALFPAAPVLAGNEGPDDALKTEALKLGYVLNDNSMVRWGSIDLSDRILTPPPAVIRTIPIEPPKKKGRDK